MEVRLPELGGEEGDGRFLGGQLEAPLLCPAGHIPRVLCQGGEYPIYSCVGGARSKVIRIAGAQF